MKLSTGRGIKFFKRPIFSVPKTLVVNTYNFSKKQISNFVNRGNKQ